jgi:hypothetical protein
MLLIVKGTALASFLFSAWSLNLGIHTIWLRYVLSVVVAYGAFLFLLWLWVLYYRGQLSSSIDRGDMVDLVDVANQVHPLRSQPSYLTDMNLPAEELPPHSTFDLDPDEWAVLLAIIAAVGSALLGSIYIIAIAPALFAELMLDGVLGVLLYHRMENIDQHFWIESAVMRTSFPFIWIALIFVVSGAIFQCYAPEAASIGGV